MKDQVLIDTITGFVEIEERKLEEMKQKQYLLATGIANIEAELAVDKERLEILNQDKEQSQ